MRPELTEDQRLIQDSVRRFVEARVAPGARASDANEVPRVDAFAGLAELGLFGAFVPPDLGGSNLDLVSAALAVEALSRGDAALAATVVIHNALSLERLLLVPEVARECLFSRLVSGTQLAGWAGPLTSTLFSTRGLERIVPTAAHLSSGAWCLSGAAPRAWLGEHGEPLLLVARSPSGLSTFLVEGRPSGLARRPLKAKLGLRGLDIADLELRDVVVPATALLGREGAAEAEIAPVIDRATVLFAAVAVGLAQASLEAARTYALERKQFGKPISEFQSIQWKIADMATAVEAARLLVLFAASVSGTAGAPGAAEKALVFASETALSAGFDAIQIHGGNGFVRELPVERYFRDAKALQLALASGDSMRAQIARMALHG